MMRKNLEHGSRRSNVHLSRFATEPVLHSNSVVTISDLWYLLYRSLLIWHYSCSFLRRGSQMQSEARPPAVATPSSSLTLLVVDDESSTREICKTVAADAGLQVLSAATTEEALRILDEHPVDIV